MRASEYKFEIWMRWGFAIALVAVMGFSFYGSPYYRMAAGLFGAPQPGPRSRCEVRISRDFEHTASLNFPGLDALLRRATNINYGVNVALEACRRDPSLKVVYLRQSCDSAAGQLSRTVYCR